MLILFYKRKKNIKEKNLNVRLIQVQIPKNERILWIKMNGKNHSFLLPIFFYITNRQYRSKMLTYNSHVYY